MPKFNSKPLERTLQILPAKYNVARFQSAEVWTSRSDPNGAHVVIEYGIRRWNLYLAENIKDYVNQKWIIIEKPRNPIEAILKASIWLDEARLDKMEKANAANFNRT